MSNKCKNSKGQSKNATKAQKGTLDIHIAFKQHVQGLKVYPTLAFQHGERLFIRGEDGQYSRLVIRALFEVYKMNQKRGVTYYNSRAERVRNGLIGGVVGVAIFFLLCFGYGVY